MRSPEARRNALGILIFSAQVPHILNVPWLVYPLFVLSIAIILIMPRFTSAIPAPLVAIVIVTAIVMIGNLTVPNVGGQGSMAPGLPGVTPLLVPLNLATLHIVWPTALSVAFVGLLETLLTAKLVDDVTAQVPRFQRTAAIEVGPHVPVLVADQMTVRSFPAVQGELGDDRARRSVPVGIDVFLEEPPPRDHPLMAFDNVILTPHNAGTTREAHANVAIYASDQWIDIFDGKVPPRLINKTAWPKYSERFQKILGFRPQPLREE